MSISKISTYLLSLLKWVFCGFSFILFISFVPITTLVYLWTAIDENFYQPVWFIPPASYLALLTAGLLTYLILVREDVRDKQKKKYGKIVKYGWRCSCSPKFFLAKTYKEGLQCSRCNEWYSWEEKENFDKKIKKLNQQVDRKQKGR